MHKVVAYLALFFFIFNCSAQEKDLFELSIEELMQVKISLASKTEETVITVPSTITVFNKNDIRALGVKNAYDIMNFVPGFQMTRGDWVGAVPKEHARGIYLDNGYILVMINGQRLNENSFGKASLYTPNIPTEIIERIEVIRGPGSAIYGSNAFLGVLNIITQKKSQALTMSIGENGFQQLSSSWHHQLSDQTSLYANASIEQSNGQSYTTPAGGQVKDPHKNTFLELGLTHQESELNIRYIENNLDEFMNIGSFSSDNIHRSNSFSVQGKSTLWQTNNQQVEAKLSYSLFEIESSGLAIPKTVDFISHDFFIGPFWRTQSTEFKLDHSLIINKQLSLNSGIEYRFTKQIQAGATTNHYDYQQELVIPNDKYYLGELTPLENIPEYSNLRQKQDMQGVYSQLKWQVNTDFTLFFGGRYDNVNGIEDKFSPRGAMVWQANNHHTVKMQYGESFRTPVNNELYSNDSVTTGNPNLTSEFVKTTELVWLFHNETFTSEVVLFQNDLYDFINKVPYSGDALFTFKNVTDKTIRGLETNLTAQLSEPLKITINYSQLFDDPINESFKRFATLALSYKHEQWRFNINTIWRDSVNLPVVNNVHFQQENYLLTSANIKYNLSSQHSLSLIAQNMFDQNYAVFDPRVYDGEVPGKGRNISLLYRYHF
jgi:iron complex outermembrane receptor protein